MNSEQTQNLPSRIESNSNLINYPSGVYPEELMDQSSGLDLKEFIKVLSSRKKSILSFALATMLLALILTLLMQPVYRAYSSIKVERYAANANIEILDNQASRSDRDFFETQIHLIQTKGLAQRVIDDLGIDTSKSSGGILSKIKGLFKAETSSPSSNDTVALFLENLTVQPISNSQLLSISYDASSPELAAKISNTVATTFVRQNLERRFENASSYKTYVTENIQITKKSLEDAEGRLNQYAREKGLIQDVDGQSSASFILKKQSEELVLAEKERIEAEASFNIYKQDKTKGASSTITDPYINSLKKSAARLETSYQALKNKRTRSARRLRKQIDALLTDINSEGDSIKSSLETKFLEASQKEKMLRAQLEKLKQNVLNSQTETTKYNRLLREVEINQLAYNKQLEQLMAVNVASTVGTNNISIIDKATPPTKKYKPSLKTNLLFGLLLGLLLGMGFAFLREFIDDTIKNTETLEKISGLPVLAQLPDLIGLSAKKLALQAAIEPRSTLSESIRSLRTSLRFSTRNGAPQSIFITSSGAAEGKSTIAVNLAIAYAQAGSKVLLIDADLRNPSIHKILELDNLDGLTNYLATATDEDQDISHPCMINNLRVIGSGPIPPDPVELLSGNKMGILLENAKRDYDHIIIDGPPVLGLADSLVLANMADATLMSIEAGKTRKTNILDSLKRLERANANILGSVMTRLNSKVDPDYNDNYYTYTTTQQSNKVAKVRSI